jgi:hypothetical protein
MFFVKLHTLYIRRSLVWKPEKVLSAYWPSYGKDKWEIVVRFPPTPREFFRLQSTKDWSWSLHFCPFCGVSFHRRKSAKACSWPIWCRSFNISGTIYLRSPYSFMVCTGTSPSNLPICDLFNDVVSYEALILQSWMVVWSVNNELNLRRN